VFFLANDLQSLYYDRMKPCNCTNISSGELKEHLAKVARYIPPKEAAAIHGMLATDGNSPADNCCKCISKSTLRSEPSDPADDRHFAEIIREHNKKHSQPDAP